MFVKERELKKLSEINKLFVILFPFTDAKTDEFLQMKIFNEDFRVSDSEMYAMLKKANLTGHGYKKEVTVKQRQNADNGILEYEVLLPFSECFFTYERDVSNPAKI